LLNQRFMSLHGAPVQVSSVPSSDTMRWYFFPFFPLSIVADHDDLFLSTVVFAILRGDDPRTCFSSVRLGQRAGRENLLPFPSPPQQPYTPFSCGGTRWNPSTVRKQRPGRHTCSQRPRRRNDGSVSFFFFLPSPSLSCRRGRPVVRDPPPHRVPLLIPLDSDFVRGFPSTPPLSSRASTFLDRTEYGFGFLIVSPYAPLFPLPFSFLLVPQVHRRRFLFSLV